MSTFVYLHFQGPFVGNVESISIGVIPLELNSLIYVANDQKYFSANGLNVTFKSYGSGFAAVNGMLKGEVDIALSSEFVIAEEALANDSFYTFGSIAKYNIYNVVARTDKGINNISHLAGKKVGVAFGTIAQFYWGNFLELNNISPSSVTLVNVPNGQSANSLANGTVDAVVTYQPIINQIKSLLSNNTIVWPAQANQFGYWDAACTTSWAKAHSDLIVRFLKALIPAENFITNHQSQSIAIVTKALNYSSSYLPTVWPNYQFSVTLDQSQILAMQDESRWLISNNLTNTNSVPNFLTYVYVNGLESVKPDAVNIIS
ncbi:MAG: NrtA/SsuA/CpmA family ABC transporter substrate-binding protein [Candidatus Bathyarchaeia archaeon]